MNKKQKAIKEIKKQLAKLQYEKTFLEKCIHEKISDLDFYNHFGYQKEVENVIGYLDMTWKQYDEVVGVIKELKRDLKGTR
jgi:endoglucanase Acf2